MLKVEKCDAKCKSLRCRSDPKEINRSHTPAISTTQILKKIIPFWYTLDLTLPIISVTSPTVADESVPPASNTASSNSSTTPSPNPCRVNSLGSAIFLLSPYRNKNVSETDGRYSGLWNYAIAESGEGNPGYQKGVLLWSGRTY